MGWLAALLAVAGLLGLQLAVLVFFVGLFGVSRRARRTGLDAAGT